MPVSCRLHVMRTHGRPRKLVAGRSRAGFTIALAVWSLSGCAVYRPAGTPSSVSPTDNVRLTLSKAGTEALKGVVGANVREVEGRVVRRSADSLVILVEQTYTSTRERFVSSGDTITVALASAERIDRREVSRKRSLLLGLGIVAAIVLSLAGISASGGGVSGSGQPAPPQP